MRTLPDQSPTIALKYAKSPVARELLAILENRAHRAAELSDEFTTLIINERELVDGKQFKFSPSQKRTLARYEEDAATARTDLERMLSSMDDARILVSLLLGAEQDLYLHEQLWGKESNPRLKQHIQLINQFSRETIALIESSILKTEFAAEFRRQLEFMRSLAGNVGRRSAGV